MFKDQRVLVTGVTGNVGWGLAQALLANGATVIGLVRQTEDGSRVAQSLSHSSRFLPLVGDLASATGAQAVADQLRAVGGAGHAMMALGGWWQGGPVQKQSPESFAPVRAGILDTQVNAAMTILPILSGTADPTYTIITGAGAKMPIPDAGFTVIAAAGVVGLSMMLRHEGRDGPVRINEVMIQTRIERTAREHVTAAADFGAFVTLWLAQGYKGVVGHFPPAGVSPKG